MIVIHFGSLCSVIIPDAFLSTSTVTVDIVADEPIHHIDLGTLQDDDTVVAGSCVYHINHVDATVFYDDEPRAQMDGGAGVLVTNFLSILHSVKFFNVNFKSKVHVHRATSKDVITLQAVGYMRVCGLVEKKRFLM